MLNSRKNKAFGLADCESQDLVGERKPPKRFRQGTVKAAAPKVLAELETIWYTPQPVL